jgi:predicted nucleic-acid-binding protein
LKALVDTNVLVRHLTGDPPAQAARATRFLAEAPALVLTEIVAAELVYVLESFYEVARADVAHLVRAVIAFPSIETERPAELVRALQLYEVERLDFAEATLVARAEATAIRAIASFDRALDRIHTVDRIEP